jgi:hypothetical protein
LCCGITDCGDADDMPLRLMIDESHIFIIFQAKVIPELLPVTQFPLRAFARSPEISDCQNFSNLHRYKVINEEYSPWCF